MVRLRGPLFSLNASKQLGKALIYKTKGGRSFLTRYSKPSSNRKTSPSLLQEQKRIIYGEAVEDWQALSDNQKSVYNESAKGNSFSGFNLFLKEYFEDNTFPTSLSYYGTRVYGFYDYANQL